MISEDVISIITILITLILGFLSKKFKFISNNLIPLQNIFIGTAIAIVEFIITKNFSTSIAVSGLLAGGTYDVFHNLNKMLNNNVKLNNKDSN